MCGENSCNVFLLLFMALGVPISATLCSRAVLVLWHAFLFLGLRFFPLYSFCLVASAALPCKNIYWYNAAGVYCLNSESVISPPRPSDPVVVPSFLFEE
jgi:hypothetical protein